jgi:hypothetical protein
MGPTDALTEEFVQIPSEADQDSALMLFYVGDGRDADAGRHCGTCGDRDATDFLFRFARSHSSADNAPILPCVCCCGGLI